MQGDLLTGSPSGIIGVDEAGKGDYFGPLVIAACFSNESIDEAFLKIGLRESKKVTDNRALALDREIRRLAPCEVVSIGPEKYNELHNKIKNLNRLLAWGHARALENLLVKVNPREVVSDQFGDKSLIENALLKKGRGVKLIQMHRAESVPAVAAASILARAEFLRRLENLSLQYGIMLPKGAGTQVDEAGRNFVTRLGRDELGKVAKIHFKNTKRVMPI
ncbi:MAG TPA: ribonuclease HIII [candidate division Zixibacteria bacterium]|nr:ribonuclease HIII [candidate division Zixibacteria bacterium]